MGPGLRYALLWLALFAFIGLALLAERTPKMPACLPDGVLYAPVGILYPALAVVSADALWQGVHRALFSAAERAGCAARLMHLVGAVLAAYGALLLLFAYQDHCYCGGPLGYVPDDPCMDAGNNFARNFEVLLALPAFVVSRIGWAVFDALEAPGASDASERP